MGVVIVEEQEERPVGRAVRDPVEGIAVDRGRGLPRIGIRRGRSSSSIPSAAAGTSPGSCCARLSNSETIWFSRKSS